jgi:nucleotide-binding universal stress UspA family protein
LGRKIWFAVPWERGLTAEEIVALAEEMGAGLVVMGSHGLGGIRRALIGSVSAAIVPHAHCPVLIVREQGDGRV